MSGSKLSILSSSDSSFCNRRVYNYAQVPSDNSSKEYKNLSNIERQNMDHRRPMSDALEHFYAQQSVSEVSFYSSFHSRSAHLKKLNQSLGQSPRAVTRNPCTTPKIVGAEVKKNIKYQPAYMQRFSTSFAEGFDYQTQQSKRASVALGEDFTHFLNEQSQVHIQPIRSQVSCTFPVLPASPPPPTLEDIPMGGCVRDRVSFFNRLASQTKSTTSRPSAQPKETFISLLRKNESKDSKATVNRLSQMMSSLSAKKSSSKETLFGSNEGKCCAQGYKSGSNSLPLPLKRKSSFEKTKVATSSIAKNMNAIGTNLKRHSLMEDLSLVVPVRLRIAEFEKRILAAK